MACIVCIRIRMPEPWRIFLRDGLAKDPWWSFVNVNGSGRSVSLVNDEYEGTGGRVIPWVPTCEIVMVCVSAPVAKTVILASLPEESVFC